MAMPPSRIPGPCLHASDRQVPAQSETQVAPGPAVHLPAFLNYLESECGMARNTLAAYRTDLLQFFAWFEKSGTGSRLQSRPQASGPLSRSSAPAQAGLLLRGPAPRLAQDVFPVSRARRRAGRKRRRAAELAQDVAAPAQSAQPRDGRPPAGGADSRRPLSAPRSGRVVLFVRDRLPRLRSGRHADERHPSRGELLPLPRKGKQGADRLAQPRGAGRRSRPISPTSGRGWWAGRKPIGSSCPAGERPSRGS